MKAVVAILALTLGNSALAEGSFPGSWAGYWQGSCELIPVPAREGGNDRVDMELVIERQAGAGKFGWKLIYIKNNGQREIRPYEMAPVRGEPGHYVLDEKNGILIDSYYAGSVLWSQFEVTGNRITTREELAGDELRVEMATFAAGGARSSGGGATPPVDAYAQTHLQKCKLRRI